MSLHVNKNIDSSHGKIELAITSGTHISAHGTHTIRAAEYHVHMHFHLVNGKWELATNTGRNVLRSMKTGMPLYKRPVPPTVVKALETAYTKAIEEFTKANEAAINEAEIKSLDYQIDRTERELIEMEAKLAAKCAYLDELKAKRHTL